QRARDRGPAAEQSLPGGRRRRGRARGAGRPRAGGAGRRPCGARAGRARARRAQSRQPAAAPRRGGRGRRHPLLDLRPSARRLRDSQAIGDFLSTRIRTAIGLVVLGVLATASSAAAGMADRIGATFALMLDDFTKAFSPLEGLVIAAEGSML